MWRPGPGRRCDATVRRMTLDAVRLALDIHLQGIWLGLALSPPGCVRGVPSRP